MHEMMVLGNGGWWKVISHEDGALMNEISGLIKGAPKSSLTPSTV